MYRMQVYDGQTTGMHWQRQKVAAEHYRNALRNAAAISSTEEIRSHATRGGNGGVGRRRGLHSRRSHRRTAAGSDGQSRKARALKSP